MERLGPVDLSSFLSAFSKFEQFCQDLGTEQKKAGAVQAYEYTFELAWKTLKRVLAYQGIMVASPRDCFREAAILGWVSDPKLWFLFLEKRNQSSHVYREEVIDEMLEVFPSFSQAVRALIERLRSHHEYTRS